MLDNMVQKFSPSVSFNESGHTMEEAYNSTLFNYEITPSEEDDWTEGSVPSSSSDEPFYSNWSLAGRLRLRHMLQQSSKFELSSADSSEEDNFIMKGGVKKSREAFRVVETGSTFTGRENEMIAMKYI